MPKSSHAARNSCLSAARRSASRRRQAGSTLKKLNLAKVRSAAIALTIPGCLLLFGAAAAEGAAAPTLTGVPKVNLVWVPPSTTVAELAQAGFSPGLMSAGLGTVTPTQTYLDVGAGNRVFNSLYDSGIPSEPETELECGAWFEQAVKRAGSAPDEIEPGLLARRLQQAGMGAVGQGPSACPLGIDLSGGFFDSVGEGKGLLVDSSAPLSLAARIAEGAVEKSGLAIAIARPTGKTDDPVPIGIAG